MHHLQMTSSEVFHHHFTIISKFVCCGCYMKKNVAFTLISFAVLKGDDCLSVQVPFDLPVETLVEILVQLLLELEVNRLEFELSTMMERPFTCFLQIFLKNSESLDLIIRFRLYEKNQIFNLSEKMSARKGQ